jgi:hypothetical protein
MLFSYNDRILLSWLGYVFIWLRDYFKNELKIKNSTLLEIFGHIWTLLTTFGHIWKHLDTFLTIIVELIKCVIKKQIQILLLDTYVFIWFKDYFKNELKFKNWKLSYTVGNIWTLMDTFGHFWTHLDTFGHFWTLLDTFGHFFNFNCPIN